MLENEQEESFLQLEDPEERIAPIKKRFKELEDLNKIIHDAKIKKNEIKKDLVALTELEETLDSNGNLSGFSFHPFLIPYVTYDKNSKHISAVLEFTESPIVFQVQAQEVTAYNKVDKAVQARKEIENNNPIPNQEIVSITLDWVEDKFHEETKMRKQVRIVEKTR